MAAGRGAGVPARVLRARPARLPHLPGRPPDPGARRSTRRADAVHPRRHHGRPEDLPARGADGVRLDLRARRLSGAGLHGRLSAPRGTVGARQLRRRSIGPGAPAHDHRLPAQPLRLEHPHPHLHRAAGRGVPKAPVPLSRLLRQPDDRVRIAPQRDRRPRRDPQADRLSSAGRPGRPRPSARATTTRTRTTGPPSRWSTTSRPRT